MTLEKSAEQILEKCHHDIALLYASDEKSYGIQSQSRVCDGDGTRSRSATPFLYALTNSVWTSGQIFIAAENCLRTLGQRTRARGGEEEQTALIS